MSPAPATVQYKTIGEKARAEDAAYFPIAAKEEANGFNSLSESEQLASTYYLLLKTGAWRSYPPKLRADLLKECEKLKIPQPRLSTVPEGKDRFGKKLEDYTVEEYEKYVQLQRHLRLLQTQSNEFTFRWSQAEHCTAAANDTDEIVGIRERAEHLNPDEADRYIAQIQRPLVQSDIDEERSRRAEIYHIETGKKMTRYAQDPVWDNITPIPQDDGPTPLAAIAYTDEYAEAIAYLRAVMARGEKSKRCLDLTEHIIKLNSAHYTVWLYRASIITAIGHSIADELEWLNAVSLANQKNYQIWHHRQLLIDHLYPSIFSSRSAILRLAKAEINFLTQMFAADSKNYHVWSYRQYVVRKLEIFPSQVDDEPNEIKSIETLIEEDVRNNSAWSHRFFLVFCDPATSTEGKRQTERDEKVPEEIVDREIKYAENQIWLAPQNQSPWNYMRGVLRKAGRDIASQESFAVQFAKFAEGGLKEEIKSTHALDLLAEIWAAKGEKEKAETALSLLGDKYDPIRKKYWDWRHAELVAATGTA